VPTAVIAGQMDENSLKTTGNTVLIMLCCKGNPLADALTQKTWSEIMKDASDAIVPVTSQLNRLHVTRDNTAPGVIHSEGTRGLGFTGPSELDPDIATGIPTEVIRLLNERTLGEDFESLP